jgi:hypothetical protein
MLQRIRAFLRSHFHGEELVALSFVAGLFLLGAVVRVYRLLTHDTPLSGHLQQPVPDSTIAAEDKE